MIIIHIHYFSEELDGKEINELSRQFLINWKASKEAKKKMKDEKILTRQITFPFIGKSIQQ